MVEVEDEAGRVYDVLDQFSGEHFNEILQLIDQLPDICAKDDNQSSVAREVHPAFFLLPS